ncbi:MAG: GFA family protein [Methyloligellaceae bacterium]
MSNEPFATGHCLCGAVSYTINSEPMRMAQCHCKDCQRASGTGHMSLAFFKADDVEIKGETASYSATADSGNINTRHFCPNCGSRIFGENSARPGMVGISVGCVDDHDWFAAQAVVYAGNRPGWDLTSEDIPNFETMPPPPK